MYISQQMLKNVYMRRFAMFSSCIVIHGVSGVLAIATHNHSSRPHRHFEKSAFYFDLAMFSCEKARSMYTNLDFLLILYTFPAVLQVFLRDVYLLIKTSHIIQSPVQAEDQQISLHLFSDALCCIRVLGIPAGVPAGSVFTLSRKNASRSVSSVRQRSRRISLLSLRSLRLCVPHKVACSACRGKVPA